MLLSCTRNRERSAIVEIGRLLKPVSQVRILPGALTFMQLKCYGPISIFTAGN